MNKFALLLVFGALTLAACEKGETKGESLVDKEAALSTTASGEKSAPLTETATPNKPATQAAADVETDDLESLKAQLNSLSGDITRLKTDLTGAEPVMAATKEMPDSQISTPRALVTDGVLKIPDSKEELADLRKTTVTGARVGEQTDRTRLVLELSNSPQSKPEVALSGKTLKIQMDDTSWPEGGAQTSGFSEQLGVFNVTEEKNDTIVTVTLNQNMSLKSQMVLPPAAVGGPYRFVVDLTPAP